MNNITKFSVAALLLVPAACQSGNEGDDLGVGARLSVDYLGDSDVVGFHYLIERVSCDPGDPIEPFSFEALVDLQDQLAPGGVTVLGVLDGESGHIFADVFVSLDPGCYDVTATPVQEMDAGAGTYTASDDCAAASADGVEVLEEETTDAPVLISQCEGDPIGGGDFPAALNHPPQFTLAIDDKFGFVCEVLEACASVSDPDNDPLELEWTQSAGGALYEPISIGALTQTGQEGGIRLYEQCAEFVSEAAGEYELSVTVYDLLEDGTRIEDALDPGQESHATLSFPLNTSTGVEPACIDGGGSVVPLAEPIDRRAGCSFQTDDQYYCDAANAAADGFDLNDTCPGGVFDETAVYPACAAMAGDPVWSDFRNAPDPDDDRGGGIAVGSDGVYSCGTDDVDNVGSGRLGVITKYDFDGNFVWESTPVVGIESMCRGIVVGSDNDPVYAGQTSGGGGWTARVEKLDGATGASVWVRTYQSVDDRFYGIGIAANDDVVPIGTTHAGGQNDFLIQRYDSAGNLQWTATPGFSVVDYAYGAAVDTAGDVYMAGYIDDNGGTAWGALWKLAAGNGAVLWSDIENSALPIEEYSDVVIDPIDDHPIVVGHDFGNGDILLRKYTPAGADEWTQTYSGGVGTGNQLGGDGGLFADVDGTIFFAGTAAGATRDLWVRSFDGADGSAILETTVDGPVGGNDYGRGIAVTTDAIYLNGEADTGPSLDIATYRLVK